MTAPGRHLTDPGGGTSAPYGAVAPAKTRRLHTIALGCQMSAADADEMAEPLRRRGWSAAAAPEDADAVLISTCTVRQHAEDRALSLIGSLKPWKEADPERVLIVAGCAAERLGPWLSKRFPFVDLVVGARSIERYPELVEEALGRRFDALDEDREAFGPPPEPRGSSAAAFVTIMRGCNYSCSYCIVPAVRGRELYRPLEDVLAAARRRLEAGARELMLLGQTVNSWNRGGLRFADLLRALDALPGLERLRFMSPHPRYVDTAFASALAECRTACEALHLPVQSGADRVLKLMKRNYTRDGFLRKVESLRRACPDLVLSTDVIVGFPTETDEEFEASLSLVEELGVASAYCFKYSPREGTEAAGLPDDVPREVKEDRLAQLNEVVDRLTRAALAAQVGRTVEVLAEQTDFGRTRTGFKVRWSGGAATGSLVPVRIGSTTRRTLLGEIAP